MDLRFYGRLADLVGSQVQLDAPSTGCSIADLRMAVAARFPEAEAQIRRAGARLRGRRDRW